MSKYKDGSVFWTFWIVLYQEDTYLQKPELHRQEKTQ